MEIDILEKLFRVQTTIEHILVLEKVDDIELRYLRRALELQTAAIAELACAGHFA